MALFEAIQHGNVHALQAALASSADLNMRDDGTPLHLAARTTSEHAVKMVELMLDAGPHGNAKDKWGMTPLHRAAENTGQHAVKMVEVMLAKGVDATVQDKDGVSPLHRAVSNPSPHAVKIVELLVSQGDVMNVKDKDDGTPLHLAARTTSEHAVKMVELMLDAGPHGNAKDKWGRTPLHRAAENTGQHAVKMVEVMLAKGVDVTVQDKDGRTPLHRAVANRSHHASRIVELLAKAATDANNSKGRTLLGLAPSLSSAPKATFGGVGLAEIAGRGDATRLGNMLDRGADANQICAEGNTPLHHAVRGDHVAAARVLLQRGADPLRPNRDGATPWDVAGAACKQVLDEAKEALVWSCDGGGDGDRACNQHLPETREWRTWPARSGCLMHAAASAGNAGCVAAMAAERPKQLFLQDGRKRVPLHDAASGGHVDAAKALLHAAQQGAGGGGVGRLINAVSDTGRTPVHEAAALGHAAVLEVLLADGAADVEACDEEGRSALAVAVEHGREACMRVLVQQGGALVSSHVKQAARSDAVRRLLVTLTRECAAQSFLPHWAPPHVHPVRAAVHSAARHSAPGERAGVRIDILRGGAEVVEAGTAVQQVQQGTYCVATGTGLAAGDSVRGTHADLYLALAYGQSEDCDVRDVQRALQRYEQRVAAALSAAAEGTTAQPCQVSGLYFLAHARLAQRQGHVQLAGWLLSEFVDVFGEGSSSWMSHVEECAVAQHQAACADTAGRGAPTAADAEGSSSSAALGADSSVDGWVQLRERLTDEQRAPMEELLRMTGLQAVKQAAVSVYRDVLADRLLRETGREEAVMPQSLNFAFLGNPGTGKTTVARLFARLLEQAGARSGHKFVQLTGSEALRKGAKVFATELASLTGGTQGVGPPSHQLRRGLVVEVLGKTDGKWYPATVVKMPQGSHQQQQQQQQQDEYGVRYTDGTEEDDVPERRVRHVGGERVGGVLFLDEAYDLDPAGNSEGRAILAQLMAAAEEHRDSVTIVLAGYKRDVEEKLFQFNAGMPSRFRSIVFDDFSDTQLADIWRQRCRDSGCEVDEAVATVVQRRLRRMRQVSGFGNAREVRKMFEGALTRAKRRLFLEGRASRLEVRVEDVIGQEPTRAKLPDLDAVLRELEAMTGLAAVKAAVQQLVETAQQNYRAELRGERVHQISLHRVFLGNPGTGKTSVAKLYGRVLRALGLLSSGETLYRTASDLVGAVVGESQKKTAAVVASAQGKVLVIDETYVLDDNLYGKQVLDTLVEKVTGAPGEDVAVVLLGYRDEMTRMLRNQNPGLTRRFDTANAFDFADFSNAELFQILGRACSAEGVYAPVGVMRAAVADIGRQRLLPNFGNAGLVTTRLHEALCAMRRRQADTLELVAEDFGPKVGRAAASNSAASPQQQQQQAHTQHFDTDPLAALEGLEEMGGLKETLRGIGQQLQVRRSEGRDTVGLLRNYLFYGSAGTGKTTAARKLAGVLHAYGLLVTDHVEETSAKGLTGEYVGQSKTRVEEAMKAARGGVLFVDEAYMLGGDPYGDEAMAKLLSMMTEDDYRDSTVVVMAGYRDSMGVMLQRNEGLQSRFTETVDFPDWSPAQCTRFVQKLADEAQPRPFVFEPACKEAAHATLDHCFSQLRQRPGWANARDARRMFDDMVGQRDRRLAVTLGSTHSVRGITVEDTAAACTKFLAARSDARVCGSDGTELQTPQHQQQQQQQQQAHTQHSRPAHTRREESESRQAAHTDAEAQAEVEAGSTADEESPYVRQVRETLERLKQQQADAAEQAAAEAELARAAEHDSRMRELEEQRLRAEQEAREVAAEAERQRLAAEAERLRAEAQRLAEEEAQRQARMEKLRRIGNCPAGFAWHREGDGWRCEGGYHFVHHSQLGE